MRWRPLGAVTTAIGLVVLALGAADAPRLANPPVMIAIALLIAAAVLTLDDPAHSLVAAVPCGFGRRLAHRVALVVPATLACLASIGWVGRRADTVSGSSQILIVAAALGAIAVATHVLLAQWRPDVAAPVAAVVPACWVVLGVTPSSVPGLAEVTDLWLNHPWAVCACASAVAVVAARRI